MPAHVGAQWSNQIAARNCPKGDIKLGYCEKCGFITNVVFDPDRLTYNETYDNSLHHSPFFQEYAASLAKKLIQRYELYNGNIIDIGCGKGEFLSLLCELGQNDGVGFDPSYEGPKNVKNDKRQITFIRDYYSDKYAKYQADLYCCRHVLEHIQEPSTFLRMLRRVIGERSETVVFFEVPNALFNLDDLSIWDIIYEHCSYFSPLSLAHVFELNGFDILSLDKTYDGQFLTVEGMPNSGNDQNVSGKMGTVDKIALRANRFEENYQSKLEEWKKQLFLIEQKGQRAVVWGAGAKGIGFVNMLKVTENLEYFVDINPNKQGKYIGGTGQKIVAPEFLKDYRPDFIIMSNKIYDSEIRRMVNNLGLAPKYLYP